MMRLVEIARLTTSSRAAADAIATTARQLEGVDVEVRDVGGAWLVVVVEGLRVDVGGERLTTPRSEAA
ncbi:MAG: hypothetical protein ACHREM_12600 [Polyangiales bacterium]